MEDENKVKNIMRILKILLIVGIIITVIILIIFSTQKNNNFKNLNDYLISIGYKETEDNVLTKEEQKQNGSIVENITYVYSVEANKFTKEMINNSTTSKEQISLLYDGTNNLNISYYYEEYNDTTSRSYTMNSATYNIKNKDFDCQIISNTQNDETRCPQIKAYSKQFAEEIQNIIDKSGINTFFSPKASKKW